MENKKKDVSNELRNVWPAPGGVSEVGAHWVKQAWCMCLGIFLFLALYLLWNILLSEAEFSTSICICLVFTFLQKWTIKTKKTKGPITTLHFTPKQNKISFQFFFFSDRKQCRSRVTSSSTKEVLKMLKRKATFSKGKSPHLWVGVKVNASPMWICAHHPLPRPCLSELVFLHHFF